MKSWKYHALPLNHGVYDEYGSLICKVSGSAIPPIDAGLKAKAVLIAGAPDLLQALEKLVDGAEAMGWPAAADARAAIAKAKGEE